MPRSERQETQRIAQSMVMHLKAALERDVQLIQRFGEAHPEDQEVLRMLGLGIVQILNTLGHLWQSWWLSIPEELLEFMEDLENGGYDHGNK